MASNGLSPATDSRVEGSVKDCRTGGERGVTAAEVGIRAAAGVWSWDGLQGRRRAFIPTQNEEEQHVNLHNLVHVSQYDGNCTALGGADVDDYFVRLQETLSSSATASLGCFYPFDEITFRDQITHGGHKNVGSRSGDAAETMHARGYSRLFGVAHWYWKSVQ